jgi:hypothetical protein
MTHFDDLGQQDRLTAIMKAIRYRNEHLIEVQAYLDQSAYPPDIQDTFNPEIWTPANWRWFDRIAPLKPKG